MISVDWNFFFWTLFVWLVALASTVHFFDAADRKEKSASRYMTVNELVKLLMSAARYRQYGTIALLVVTGLSVPISVLIYSVARGYAR